MEPNIVIKTENPDLIQVAPGKSTCNSRRLAYAVCGLILGILVAVLIVSILIYGNTKTKDVTFHIAHTGETIKENIVITDTEEIILTSRATFIFDYENGWLVTKVSDAGVNACYISEFKINGSIEKERENLEKIKTDVLVIEDDATYTQYDSSDKVVEAAMLSRTAASRCQHSRLIWFTEVTNQNNQGLVKRESDGKDMYAVVLPGGMGGALGFQEHFLGYGPWS